MSATRPSSAQTLGATLERDRLEHRVTRMNVAVDSLRRRISESRREPPRHIRHAIAEFETQMAAMNARLWDLDHGGRATTDERRSDSDERSR